MTKIQWTNRTWNPTTGCKMVSEGCRFCYAQKMTKRLAGMGQEKYKGILTDKGKFNGTVRTHDAELMKPFTWKKPCMVFVNSMSDLFHEDVPFEFIDEVFKVMAANHKLTFQVLTKRPERMAKYLNEDRANHRFIGYSANRPVPEPINWPLPNVWLGTSVENQAAANERIRHLLACPSAVRFLSCEPLLGPVDITNKGLKNAYSVPTRFVGGHPCEWTDPGDKFIGGIHWVIAGGESGSPKARPMHPDWARSLRDQCARAKVPFFFKQWGDWIDLENCPDDLKPWCGPTDGYVSHAFDFSTPDHGRSFRMYKVGKHKSGRLLDGVEHDEFPTTKAPFTETYNADHRTPCGTNHLPS